MPWWVIAFISVVAGSIGIWFGIFYSKRLADRYRDSLIPINSSERIIKNAAWRRDTAIKAAQQTTQEHLDADATRLEEEREVVRRLQANFELELDQKQSNVDKRANQHTTKEENLKERAHSILETVQIAATNAEQAKKILAEYETHLAIKGNVNLSEFLQNMRTEAIHLEKLSISKTLLDRTEELKLEGNRYAKEVLNVVNLRYNPKFLWPKLGFNVETPSETFANEYFSPSGELVLALVKDLDISIDIIRDKDDTPPHLKISGGSGVEKEAIRLTLEDIIARCEFSVPKVLDIREKFRKIVIKNTIKLGEEAAKKLGLANLDLEILKLIGALNYRTSHRQNQYYHSMEVACLAGMLADELGLDAQLAKRSGILHDIGKALDYKIEGSHAVISGDFALAHGESQEVVDIVLSHHDDKILETPYAFVLKAADAMSGARPGARIEMEEGYQKRIDSIQNVIESFNNQGVTNSAIMNAGREVHVFVDAKKIKNSDTEPLALSIVKKLESDVEFPGQIRVTVVRRIEVVEVA